MKAMVTCFPCADDEPAGSCDLLQPKNAAVASNVIVHATCFIIAARRLLRPSKRAEFVARQCPISTGRVNRTIKPFTTGGGVISRTSGYPERRRVGMVLFTKAVF